MQQTCKFFKTFLVAISKHDELIQLPKKLFSGGEKQLSNTVFHAIKTSIIQLTVITINIFISHFGLC